jgi:ABC-type multidrug transport system ATPase subunit/pSer/pThr/pTyr-binding forkhead associated (FHA) protein
MIKTEWILSSLSSPASFMLDGDGPWRVGRGLEVEFRIEGDPGCSRVQAEIARSGEGFLISPLSRSTPVMVDGARIEGPVALRAGSVVAFSAQQMVLQSGVAGTVMMAVARPMAAGATVQRETTLAGLYIGLERTTTVGRQALADQVVLDHPTISRTHAAFERSAGGVSVRDLGSTNGTFLNGARLAGSQLLRAGDRVGVGPFELMFDGSALIGATRTGNAELRAIDVSKDIPRAGAGGAPLRLLHGINLAIRPRSLVCIIGASGSGKSTLMNILAGRSLASAGQVALNGQDLHANFSALKQDIAFVPQQDVLHEHLTLWQALDYAARLRLPPDTTRAQRRETVETAARSVDLFSRLDTRIGALSGGQKKRASLASEILNRPSLLLLDEVTSGLDESTDGEIMRLLRRLAEEGMTIVAVTHTLANIEEFCHDIVCMGRGGHMTFFGAPSETLAFFGARRLGEVFARMEEGGAEAWRERFDGRGAGITRGGGGRPVDARTGIDRRGEAVPALLARVARQFGVLTDRNVRLLLNDRGTLRMAALQSVLIGGLMGYAFGAFGEGWQKVNSETSLMLLLGFLAIWLGCNGTAKDIVGELAIYRRERDINLSTASFIASKYCVSGLFAMVQMAVAAALVAVFAEALPGGWGAQLPALLLGCAAGSAIGLVISALAATRDQATTIVPLALVPQLILAGVLVPRLPALADLLAKVAISGYWLMEAMKATLIARVGPVPVANATTGLPTAMTAQPLWLCGLVLALHAVAFLLVAYGVTLVRNGRRGL